MSHAHKEANVDDLILQGMIERNVYTAGNQGKTMMNLIRDMWAMHFYLLYQGGESANIKLTTDALEAAIKELVTLHGILGRMYEIANPPAQDGK